MEYKEKDYKHLIGLEGFSDQLLTNHLALYSGYVTNTNKLQKKLTTYLTEGKTGEPEFAELTRRFGWEWNGMRLHEHYFEGLSKKSPAMGKKLKDKLTQDFGSVEAWMKDFKALGTMRGIGWVVLYLDPVSKQLFNIWINEHDVGHLSGAVPILVMDVFEHAFMVDYNLKKVDYIEAYFVTLDWEQAEKRIGLVLR
jgi:superoxide dismutase, Fe-Mn family